MNAEATKPRGALRLVQLPRFGSVLECTMPAGDMPCSRTECRYHLAYRQPGEHRLEPTRDCALTVANEGPHTLEEVAEISGLTREWVRQMEDSALEKLASNAALKRQYDESE